MITPVCVIATEKNLSVGSVEWVGTPLKGKEQMTKAKKTSWWEIEFDERFPCLVKPIGYTFTKDGEKQEVEGMTYEKDSVKAFIRQVRQEAIRETIEVVEQEMLNRILYIGNEVPKANTGDKRSRFVLLGYPQEFLNSLKKKGLNG